MKRNPFRTVAALLIIGVVAMAMLSYVLFGTDNDEEENQRLLIAEMVDNKVMEYLSEPITVSQMISQDTNLKNMLVNESDYSEDEIISNMRNYLYSIKRQFGFSAVYVISDSSKNYYSYAGLNKVVDPENDSFDTWYSDFLETGRDYQIESSTDEVNRNELTVFLDRRVQDDEGNLLGVSGVGLQTNKVMHILEGYEEQFGVRIDYVTANGLVQMSSRTSAVHSSYVSGIDYPSVSDDTYHYQSYGVGGFAVVRYVEELGWYLVIRSERTFETSGLNYVYFFALVLILIISLAVLFTAGNQMNAESGMILKSSKNVDGETGLPNRDYFARVYGETGILNTTQYQSIAEFAIDEFEKFESTSSYNRTLQSVVRTAREVFGQGSELMRWGKNSFVILFEIPVDDAEILCKEFCKSIEERGQVSISVGLTEIDLKETLMGNYYRAVQNLYLVKELGGNNVKRG
ncbi:MAG: hypothetical protein K5675_05770 [Lachnospiraceae bacterium]|nr:hypothetical protein [Lachnospiraceae bacterium]